MPHSLPDSFHSGDKVSREVNDRDYQAEHQGFHWAPPSIKNIPPKAYPLPNMRP